MTLATEELLRLATLALRLTYAIKRVQDDPTDAALLREEQALADQMLDAALALARSESEN